MDASFRHVIDHNVKDCLNNLINGPLPASMANLSSNFYTSSALECMDGKHQKDQI